MFVSQADNSIKARAKHYKFISPAGKLVEIYNLSEFCRDNGLHIGAMSSIHLGSRKKHKGWTRDV